MPPAIPVATYRLQLTPQFGFDAAAAVVPYLKALGVSHLYASPFFKARAGTTHGYDIIDHNALNPELGGDDAFLRLSDALNEADIGLILDFVPNHMAVHGADNAWWLDVLEWGPRSRYAKFFDIDWDTQTGQPRVLLPILGRPYGEVLEEGEIELRYDAAEGSFSAWYFEHRLPIGPNRYGEILQRVVATANANDKLPGQQLLELSVRYRGPRNPPPDKAPAFKRDISSIAGGHEIIEQGLSAYRATSDVPGALAALHYLLERQHYRPAHWRLAASDINYRRFFDINTLAGLRTEEPDVFKAINRFVFRLIGEGRLHGLRLDHIDGMSDPGQYLRRLQRELQGLKGKQPFYVVVEKILAEEEPLPKFPGMAGTTGYEWLNVISRALVHGPGLDALDRTWREAAGAADDFANVLRRSRQRVLQTILSSEFTVLAGLLARIAAGHYSTRDFTAARLREALELFVLNFPVYRTYISAAGPSDTDRSTVRATIDKACAEWFGADGGVFDFLSDAVTLDLIAPGATVRHSLTRVRRFAFKLQQFTGPMMAKSLEDTAFYRYHRLLALNEVGGDPTATELGVEPFHARMTARSETFPHGLTATATHDTKRGEDARARLLSLSELADEWTEGVRHWRRLYPAPHLLPAHAYMIYQALIGAWPLDGVDATFVARMQDYAIKAAREGKEKTSWVMPDEDYEAKLKDFVATLLDQSRSAEFLASFDAFARRVALLGALRGLAQVTLKMTLPGVPDVYQGTEFWDLSLVDPDNRRPVDFRERQEVLATLEQEPDWKALASNWQDGRIKLALMRTLLELRNRQPDLFAHGRYRAVEVSGRDGDQIIAYARTHKRGAVLVVVCRRFGHVSEDGRSWPSMDTLTASLGLSGLGRLRSVIGGIASAAGASVPAGELLGIMPVAIFETENVPV